MGKTVTLEAYERGVERRKARFGYAGDAYVATNSGVDRTPSKRALLKAMADAAKAESDTPRSMRPSKAVSPD